MTIRRPSFDAGMLLLIAILAAHLAILLTNYRHPIVGDEFYYVGRAEYMVQHHQLEPAAADALAAERGSAWGNSDWRPAGYPLLLAVMSTGDFRDPAGALRLRVALVQFAMLAAVLLALYRLAIRHGGVRHRVTTALLLGVPPWTFAFVNDIVTDPTTLVLVSFGLIALAAYVVRPEREIELLVIGTALMSLTLFFRPEMIVMPPLMVATALVLRARSIRIAVRDAVAAALVFCALVGVQVGYRTWFTGRLGIFGGLHILNRGAFDWANASYGTEKELYDFVYAVTNAAPTPLPERAFDSAQERGEVARLVARGRARGTYSADDDAAFERLAREKAAQHPLRMIVLRVWHGMNPWLNLDTNRALLVAMRSVPRAIRRAIVGALLLLRVALLVMAAGALARALIAARRGTPDAADSIVLLFISFAVIRTTLTGVILNWNVSRYVLAAWPPVQWCACALLRPRTE